MTETFTEPPIEARHYEDTYAVQTELSPMTDYVLSGPNLEDGLEYGVTATIGIDVSKEEAAKSGEEPDEFLVIDLRNAPRNGIYKTFRGRSVDSTVEYLLVNKHFDIENGTGFKGLRKGEEFTVGRSNPATEKRFGKMSSYASREHFKVGVDSEGLLHVADLGTTNGTHILSAEQPLINGWLGSKESTSSDNPKHDEQASPKNEQRPTSEQRVVEETPAQEWERKKAETYQSLDPKVQLVLARIEADFKSEVPFDIAAGIIKNLSEKEAQGMSPIKTKKELYKKWHPDLHRDAPEEQRRLAESVSKLIGMI